ncbi:NUDIX domain-containing protein [Planococcus sp. X10-3]|uniref:NUDIX domain-containing protein n=1 Tax=Planococcus sp. X10-3 TaxID=3061240 RepID=UPI003BAE4A60
MNIRNSAKAVIIKDSKLLLTINRDKEGIYFIFPGGGQDHGEALTETVKRECLEEVGAVVEVRQLLHIREYIGRNHEYSQFDSDVHQIEYYFFCELANGAIEFSQPTNPDSHQIGMEWVAVDDLKSQRIYPKAIVPAIEDFAENKNGAVYLGDVN